MSTLTPGESPIDVQSSYRAIEALIMTYAELMDHADFAGLGALLANSAFGGGAGHVTGSRAIQELFEDMVIVYGDGTPRSKHVTSNVVIEIDELAGSATSRSYFTVLQALPGVALQPVAAGRYHDRFEAVEGAWRFSERNVLLDLVGDVSRHLRRPVNT